MYVLRFLQKHGGRRAAGWFKNRGLVLQRSPVTSLGSSTRTQAVRSIDQDLANGFMTQARGRAARHERASGSSSKREQHMRLGAAACAVAAHSCRARSKPSPCAVLGTKFPARCKGSSAGTASAGQRPVNPWNEAACHSAPSSRGVRGCWRVSQGADGRSGAGVSGCRGSAARFGRRWSSDAAAHCGWGAGGHLGALPA